MHEIGVQLHLLKIAVISGKMQQIWHSFGHIFADKWRLQKNSHFDNSLSDAQEFYGIYVFNFVQLL